MRLLRSTILLLILTCLPLSSALAQELDRAGGGRWNLGVFSQGGSGLNARKDVQMWSTAGFRAGYRIGHPFGRGSFRTTFEMNAEVIPLEQFYWMDNATINGFAANPVILKWSFVGTPQRRITPFFLMTGGLVVTNKNFPPGDTNTLNFTPGFGFGAHFFTKPRQAITADVRAIHISNATLGNHNPGVNASLQMSIGYTWFK